MEELEDENELLTTQKEFLTGLANEFLVEDRRLGLLMIRKGIT
jgi:hypothetical protein